MKNLFKKLAGALCTKKTGLLLGVLLVAVFVPHLALADTTTTTTTTSSTTTDSATINAVAELLSVGISFLNSLLWPILLVIGDLMDVNFIIGPGMEDRMILIYNQTRSLANIAFVIMLLVVALYNVLGLGGEGELAIKTALPKVILGVILVNFTLPIGRIMLDAANVGTNIAFALPSAIEGYDFNGDLTDFTNQVCFKSIDESTGEPKEWYSTETSEEKNVPLQTQLFCTDTTTVDTGTDDGNARYDGLRSIVSSSYFTDLNKNNLALIMAVNMGRLGSLSLLKQGSVFTITDLSVNMIFAIIMYLVFAISFLVMGIVLIARIFTLWIALALSPLAVLAYVIPQIKEWVGGGAGDLSKKVIKSLVSPIIMGVSLSLGYLLMDAWNHVDKGGTTAFDAFGSTKVINTQFLLSGIDDLPKLILAIASIVVVWTGIFAAASDTYASGITETIKGLGEGAAKALGKGALAIPTLSIGAKADGPKIETSPLAVFGLMEDQIRRYSTGTFAQEGIEKLGNQLGIPMYGMHQDVGQTSQNLARQLGEAAKASKDNRISSDTLTDMANTIDQLSRGSKLDSGLQKEITDKTTEIKQQIKSGEYGAAMKAMGDLLTDKILKKENEEKLEGAKNIEDLRKLAEQVKGKNKDVVETIVPPSQKPAPATPAPAPAAPATPPPATAPTPPPVVASSIPGLATTGNIHSNIEAAQIGLAGLPAPTPATTAAATAATALITDIATAHTALNTLQTAYNAANLTAAQAAVKRARDGATALQSSPGVIANPSLKSHVDAAQSELDAMNTQIAGITIATPPTP